MPFDDAESTAAAGRRLLEHVQYPVTPEALAVLERILQQPAVVFAIAKEASALLEDPSFEPPAIDDPLRERMEELYREPLERLHAELDRPLDGSLLTHGATMGPQHVRLLGVLTSQLGHAVPLAELLVANELRPETSRRLRELRGECGSFQIETIGGGDSVAYALMERDPRIDACAEWWLIKNIKDSGMTTPDRLLTLLASRQGQPVPLDDLMEVNPRRSTKRSRGAARTAQSETARRVRQLREDGWQVSSGADYADSDASHYVLETLERLPAYERMPLKVRDAVLRRAKHRCEECGWGPEDGRIGRKRYIEVHHESPQSARPEDVNDPDNLVCLCNVCHDARHLTEPDSSAGEDGGL